MLLNCEQVFLLFMRRILGLCRTATYEVIASKVNRILSYPSRKVKDNETCKTLGIVER